MRPEGTVTLQTASKQQNYSVTQPKPSHQLVWSVMVPFAIQVCAPWKGTFTLTVNCQGNTETIFRFCQ